MRSYNAFHKEIQKYWMQDAPEKVLEALKTGLSMYSKHQEELMFEGIMACIELGLEDESLDLMRNADTRGFWYPYEVFPEEKAYQPFIQKWTAKRTVTATQVLQVGHETERHSEPNFLALHGWGEDLHLFRRYFNSSEFERRGKIHYLQSSQQIGSIQYVWNDHKRAEKDIRHYLCSTFGALKIHAIGGFSQGGYLALDMVLNGVVEVKKLVLVCPEPEDYALENIRLLAERGVKVLLITGTEDSEYPRHEKLHDLMRRAEVNVRYEVVEGMKHWMPDDISLRLDAFL